MTERETTFYYGQKPDTKKIKPKVTKLNVNIMDYHDKCSTTGYFRSCRAIINKINRHYGWDEDIMPIRKFEEHYDEIVQFLLNNYMIRDHNQLGSKTAHIIYMMKMVGYNGPFITKQKALYSLPIEIKPVEKNYDEWEDLVEKMKLEMLRCRSLSGYMVLLCYTRGYPLRLGDIINTNINKPVNESSNWLDLETRTWYINKDYTKNRRARQFEISKELADDIEDKVHESGWLVCRNNGQPYKSQVVLKHLGVHQFKVNQVRNSFETHSYARTDLSEDEKNNISINVLGHEPTTARAYYTPNDLAKKIMESQQQ